MPPRSVSIINEGKAVRIYRKQKERDNVHTRVFNLMRVLRIRWGGTSSLDAARLLRGTKTKFQLDPRGASKKQRNPDDYQF